jgi:uncharacterized protein YaiE (UPF0345 family)
MAIPEKFEGVSIPVKANIYFGGRVVSHSVLFADGTKKTLGLIYEGSFHFGTAAAEEMAITAGACRAKLDGKEEWLSYTSGKAFRIPENSGFDIVVENGICEYVCSFGPFKD